MRLGFENKLEKEADDQNFGICVPWDSNDVDVSCVVVGETVKESMKCCSSSGVDACCRLLLGEYWSVSDLYRAVPESNVWDASLTRFGRGTDDTEDVASDGRCIDEDESSASGTDATDTSETPLSAWPCLSRNVGLGCVAPVPGTWLPAGVPGSCFAFPDSAFMDEASPSWFSARSFCSGFTLSWFGIMLTPCVDRRAESRK